MEFERFSEELWVFLEELEENNERAWFEAHKGRYEALVREPALAFIRAMRPRLLRLSDSFLADDRRQGGSLMRIYRDVRFSEDKSPYKTNVGIQFRHRVGKDVHAPGLYVHLAQEEQFVALGMWRPASAELKQVRSKIAAEPERWLEALSTPEFVASGLVEGGESLSRPPKGYAKDHPAIEALKRKDFILSRGLTREEAQRADLPELVEELFMAGSAHTRFLCEALGVSF